MNQKDYKAISEINKKYINCFVLYNEYVIFCNAQADYFEKEDYEIINECNCGCSETKIMGMPISGTYPVCNKCGLDLEKWTKEKKVKLNRFNREQFLKDCGVKE